MEVIKRTADLTRLMRRGGYWMILLACLAALIVSGCTTQQDDDGAELSLTGSPEAVGNETLEKTEAAVDFDATATADQAERTAEA